MGLHLLAAFLSGFAIDILTTLVFHYTNANKGWQAASIGVVANACVLFVFVDITKDHTLAVPYLLGVFIGGIIGIRIKQRLERRSKAP